MGESFQEEFGTELSHGEGLVEDARPIGREVRKKNPGKKE